MSGAPGRNFACNLRVRSAVLYTLSYRSVESWQPRMDSHHQPPDSKSGALLVELQGYDPPTGVAPISRRYQRRASLPTLWRNLKWSGTSVLPRVFTAPAAMQMALRVCRRALSRHAFADPNGADCCLPHARTRCVFLSGGATGSAPRSTQCHCAVLLLDDCPEMERAPGLAPGKSGFASRRLDDFGIARFWKWGGRRVLPPLGDLHRIECWLLHHGLRLKVILRPALPRHGPHYECGALLISATEELKWCSREDSHLEPPPSQSGMQNSYTSGAMN